MLSLLAAEFRPARRPVRRLARTLVGLDIAPGMVAKLERQTALVLGPVDAELAEAVRSAPASHIDETPWRQAHEEAWLWVGTGEGVTHSRVAPNRKAETARQVLGDEPAEVVICDRSGAHNRVGRRSWCWAHPRREFQAMIDRSDGGSAVGRSLLKPSDGLFRGWHRVADGELSWDDFPRWAGSLRVRVHEELGRGESSPSAGTAATCRHLLGGEDNLWRFLAGDGVGPTNNPAERALRHGVLWRKSSGGTASEWGSRFASRMLSVVATCRGEAARCRST